MNLQDAALHGRLKRVQFLLGQGVDKDETNDDGCTALYNAAWKGHFAIVQCLVEQGADKEKASNDGNLTPLYIAANCGQLDVVRYLLEQGVDREKIYENGWTPLHNVAINGRLELAMLLMSYGADLNVRDNYGYLPIDVAWGEEMKQAIRDEPRRRMDHGYKRATEQDRNPNIASAQQEDDEEEGQKDLNNNGPRIDQGTADTEEAKILAEINEDSEPSSDEEG